MQAAQAPAHNFWNYAWASLPNVTGVTIAALCAFGYTFYFNVRTARNDVLKDVHSDLSDIESLITEYWLGDHASKDEKEKSRLDSVGHELRSKLNSSMIYRDRYLFFFKKEDQERYKELDTKLFMAATGGDFQTKRMRSSPQTYNDIITILYDLRALMRKTRGRKTI
ncbi:MAG: hypothetical protein ABF479_14420 [Gluconacetobacter sp.]